MRHGEELGLRWDIAFFQMVLETGALSFTGDVRATQNNFAGLGASGGGAHGEAFADVSSGVKAHLQHLMMYAGEHIDNPVAERTRKVQEWGVLTDWQKSIKGPMTFTLVAKQWAPTSRNYVRDLSTIASDFYTKACNGPDPQPELVQEARKGREGQPRNATGRGRRPAARRRRGARRRCRRHSAAEGFGCGHRTRPHRGRAQGECPHKGTRRRRHAGRRQQGGAARRRAEGRCSPRRRRPPRLSPR